MPKKFAFSDDGSRYHTLKYHNRRFWGRPVYKAVVDAGFTCPNIDGSCGVGGCVYCSGGSGYFTAPELSVREQILRETERIHAVHPEAGIIAYFQAHTNTYGTLGRLRESGKYQPMERESYVETAVRQLEYFPPETVIERLTGDGGRDSLLAPLWSLDKRAVLGGIMKRQKQLDSIQGLRFQEG